MNDRIRNCYICGAKCYGKTCRKCFESGTKGNHANKRKKTKLRSIDR